MQHLLNVLLTTLDRALRAVEASWFDSTVLTATWRFGCCL